MHLQRQLVLLTLALALVPFPLLAQVPAEAPAPPTDLVAKDHPFDGGAEIDLSWTLSRHDPGLVEAYAVYRSLTAAEIASQDLDRLTKAVRAAKDAVTDSLLEAGAGLPETELRSRIRDARAAAAAQAKSAVEAEIATLGDERFELVEFVDGGQSSLRVRGLVRDANYSFRIAAVGSHGARSDAVVSAPTKPTRQWFDGGRFYLLLITFVFCGAVVYWIQHAAQGKELNVRKISGLEAVDEAVGRATEMGRSVMYVPGIQDMNEIQTIASMTVLSRVSKTAAGYDVKVEVPTSKSLVMTTAREIVRAAFLSAGRPDSYNEDLIYYVTDEQFGYVAYLSGLMVREKPAACFYMGAFFAESLILAETGNSIGAIQVAGTAMPAQLPFFVAACDYTLIGEEFFAASAYLSGSPEELGSLKGQDVGKIVVGLVVAAGVAMATLATMTGSEALSGAVDFLRNVILT